MSYQRFGSRIKAVSQDGTSEVVLPIDTLEARPNPYVPEGGTALKLYDDRRTFRAPSYGIMLTIEYAYERTEFIASAYGTMKDLLQMYHNGKTVDFLLKYNRDDGTYTSASETGIAPYRAPAMIPDIKEDVANVMFESQARQKPRSLELMSDNVEYTFSQVEWMWD